MKIFDCFMYFDEDLVLDLRLNYLDKFVDKFVIVESTYNHKGERRKPLFNIDNFQKFKDKITYLLLDEEAPDLMEINDEDNQDEKYGKLIMNAVKRENFQRNFITEGLKEVRDEDWIIISDLDEIPNFMSKFLKIFYIKERFSFFTFMIIG